MLAHDSVRNLTSIEQLAAMFYDTLKLPILVVDSRYNIVYANPALGELFQHPPDKFHDQNLKNLFRVDALFSTTGQFKFKTAGSDVLDLEYRVASIPSTSHYNVQISDVTLQRRSQEIRAAMQQLQADAHIGSQTRHLMHTMKGLFSALRGLPRSTARRAQRLLRDPDLSNSQREELEVLVERIIEIESASKDIAGIFTTLVDLGRSGKYSPQVVDVNYVLHEMNPVLSRLESSDVSYTLTTNLERGAITYTDPCQLMLCLLNLTKNGLDAMQNKGTITISTSSESLEALVDHTTIQRQGQTMLYTPTTIAAGQYVVVRISDKGEGISGENLSKIFGDFTSKGFGKGSGLGLQKVYDVMKQSQGGVLVRTQQGAGTTFELYFPLKEREEHVVIYDPLMQIQDVVGIFEQERYQVHSTRHCDDISGLVSSYNPQVLLVAAPATIISQEAQRESLAKVLKGDGALKYVFSGISIGSLREMLPGKYTHFYTPDVNGSDGLLTTGPADYFTEIEKVLQAA